MPVFSPHFLLTNLRVVSKFLRSFLQFGENDCVDVLVGLNKAP